MQQDYEAMPVSDSAASVLNQAFSLAFEQGIPVLAASTTGRTAREMLRLAKDFPSVKILVVTYPAWRVPAEWRWSPGMAAELAAAGVKVLAHRSFLPPVRFLRWIEKTFGISGAGPGDRALVRRFGTGGKVCFKIAQSAVRQKYLRDGERVLTVAGRGHGADTALLLKIVRGRPWDVEFLRAVAVPEAAGNCDGLPPEVGDGKGTADAAGTGTGYEK